jgi:hypothetical protein
VRSDGQRAWSRKYPKRCDLREIAKRRGVKFGEKSKCF